jgi:hypothetical protein
MTYTQKDDTANGMVDWYRRWPKGTENPKSDARSQFLGEYLTDGILPDRFQNKMQMAILTSDSTQKGAMARSGFEDSSKLFCNHIQQTDFYAHQRSTLPIDTICTSVILC